MSATAILEPPVMPAIAVESVSERQALQDRLVEFLRRSAERWTAPYGIDSRQVCLPSGGVVRFIYFGVRNRLAVRVALHTSTHIVVTAVGDLAHIVVGSYASADDFEQAVFRLLRDVP